MKVSQLHSLLFLGDFESVDIEPIKTLRLPGLEWVTRYDKVMASNLIEPVQ